MAFENRSVTVILLLIACVCSYCTQPAGNKPKQYSILVMSDDHRQYVLQTDTLDQGVAHPIEDGAPIISPPRIWYYTLVKNGYYYFVNTTNHYFVKNRIEGKRFIAEDSVLLPGFGYPDNSLFFHPDSVLIVNGSVKSHMPKQYARINVHTMKAQIAELPIPAPAGPFAFMTIGFTWFRNNSIWMGYTYHFSDKEKGYGSSDTVYLSELAYPSLALQHTVKDTRSTYPGNINTSQQNTFTDEQGNFYFLTCPGIVRGGNPGQPTAIYRIDAKSNTLDTSYFFDISASPIKNHAYGLWYLGGNKAIIRSERKDLFTTFEEHYLLPHIEFYVIDLLTKETRKLDLPLDRGSSRTCVLVENGHAYISINDGKDGNDIWVYETATGALKKGLHLAGKIDYIFRIEKLFD